MRSTNLLTYLLTYLLTQMRGVVSGDMGAAYSTFLYEMGALLMFLILWFSCSAEASPQFF